MSKLSKAPELSGKGDQKIRTSTNGVRRYYQNGVLHRDPSHGPAIEDTDGSGPCYLSGELLTQLWYCGRYFISQEALDAELARVVDTSPAGVVVEAMKRTEKPSPKYMDAASQQKHKDPFDKLGSRVRVSSMADLQKLYSQLSSGGGNGG